MRGRTGTQTEYVLTDTLSLWWLGDPATPVFVGTLRLLHASQGVSLRYDANWLRNGFALSEDLPLIDTEFLPVERETAVGAVEDARPDRWGERVIRYLDQPQRLSLLEYLYFAGDERFGALGVSRSPEQYDPRWLGPLPTLAEVSQVALLVEKILSGESVPIAHRRLIAPGVTMGGARPKALLEIKRQPWVVKFSEPGAHFNSPLVEHAAMTLAARAGIRVAHTMPVALSRGHAIAIKRFDRKGKRRVYALSAYVALRAAGEVMGYPELAQLLRRRGVAAQGRHQAQMKELFRRMVFNILIDNTDDHEKNHVLLMTARGDYELAPAFDVLPSGLALGYQQMRVGAQMTESSLPNALSEHAQFGLSLEQAHREVRRVVRTVEGWREHFLASGVSNNDIDALARQIDRPFLADQRSEWGAPQGRRASIRKKALKTV